MMIVRPIERKDLDALLCLAEHAGVGMTSLPADKACLTERIERSIRSFANEAPRAEQGYMFVLQDSQREQIAGVCALESAVGLAVPWYNYRIGTTVHASQDLEICKRHEALFLSNDHTGYSELCSLYLYPEYRTQYWGALLSKSRLLFLAQYPECFAEVLVAELRGVCAPDGRSPFWEALGRHFFSIDFASADYLTGVGKKTFVAELMPKHPIYVELLPEAAQQVIRVPHDQARRAWSILQAEGFRCEGYVDIFDAGPTMQAYVSEIRAVRESYLAPARIASAPEQDAPWYLVAKPAYADFRVILARGYEADHFNLTPEQAQALEIEEGDRVRCVSLLPLSGQMRHAMTVAQQGYAAK